MATNGMNKKNKLVTVSVILGVLYAIVILLFIFSALNFPKLVKNTEISYLRKVEEKINTIIQYPLSTMGTELDALIEEYSMEIVIEYQGERIYQSSDIQFSNGYVNVLNPEAVSLESSGTFTNGGKSYHIWYSVYRVPLGSLINDFVLAQIVLNFIAFAVVLALILILQRLLISPLSEIKNAIYKLDKYDFDVHLSEKDEVRVSINEFARRLNSDLQKISYRQTVLSSRLQEKEIDLETAIMLSRGMIHELKTPLYQVIHRNEEWLRRIADVGIQRLAQENVQYAQAFLDNINEVLAVLKEPEKLLNNVVSFDLVNLMVEEVKKTRNLFSVKKLSLELDLPEKKHITSNRVFFHLLLQNMMINCVQYAQNESEIFLGLEEVGNRFIIQCRNLSSRENIERMLKNDQILNVVAETHRYSSGTGLFIMENLTRILGGKYEIQTTENEVRIYLEFGSGE